ncbi:MULTISPECIES: hypothetical protein [unclassified Sphingopyxis]|uniref:hypothetical protein n=1 Tax=unclassified Sphingopyxis TaxID=2614943 RepID=UPI0007361BA7|nr:MULTISPECIES: hypothetical protein [unclassified Sphingopyxis]KTE24650.1 hypothetical protein ATE62_22450 [Sphingopyxis sp. HIX]KTE72581.1 hypothetical protein ATE72_22230 [Sphingopyxis sp. HXXIV]
MRHALAILAAGTALLATPAFAQLGAGDTRVGNQVGVGTGNVGGTLGNVSDRLGNTVDRMDGAIDRTVDPADLKLAAREDVRAGAEIRDAGGTNIGTVQSVEGDVVVVIKGGKLYNVPLSEIYRDASGKTRGLVTRLSRAEIKARGNVGASTANN